ncbi:hypothetical protein C0995_012985 [Termitomyces sp. Mi166|nr:hypothetical protein C0995_012985 [Termitomyces sp. Mi166\
MPRHMHSKFFNDLEECIASSIGKPLRQIFELSLDPAKTAALSLYNPNQYGQGKQSLDDYIDSFHALAEQAGYPDGLQLCLTFREGLYPTLMECIDNSAEGHPNNSIATWYKLPVTCSLSTVHASSIAPLPPAAAGLLLPGISIEVDASHQHALTPLSCCCCKKPGHFACYCPQGLEVHYLSSSEQEELLLQLLAAKDASGDPSDASLVDRSSEVSPAGPSTEQKEDF